jgi:hypothetical protein
VQDPTLDGWEPTLGHPYRDETLAKAALAQAILLVEIHTGVPLSDLPTDPPIPEVANLAIFQTAEYIQDSSTLRSSLAAGIAAERIGSWSYTLRSDARILNLGQAPTGLQWLDLLLDLLNKDEDSASTPWSAGVDVFDNDLTTLDVNDRPTLVNSHAQRLAADPTIWWFW